MIEHCMEFVIEYWVPDQQIPNAGQVVTQRLMGSNKQDAYLWFNMNCPGCQLRSIT